MFIAQHRKYSRRKEKKLDPLFFHLLKKSLSSLTPRQAPSRILRAASVTELMALLMRSLMLGSGVSGWLRCSRKRSSASRRATALRFLRTSSTICSCIKARTQNDTYGGRNLKNMTKENIKKAKRKKRRTEFLGKENTVSSCVLLLVQLFKYKNNIKAICCLHETNPFSIGAIPKYIQISIYIIYIYFSNRGYPYELSDTTTLF